MLILFLEEALGQLGARGVTVMFTNNCNVTV